MLQAHNDFIEMALYLYFSILPLMILNYLLLHSRYASNDYFVSFIQISPSIHNSLPKDKWMLTYIGKNVNQKNCTDN